MLLLVVCFACLGTAVLIMDFAHARTEITDGLSRNSYGEGSRTEQLEVILQEEETRKSADLDVQISERKYSDKELESLFKRCISKIEKEMLGENKSPDRVETNLNLMTTLEGMPVEISWESDRYDVINVYGEIQEEELAEEGTKVQLSATITYLEDIKRQTLYECEVMVYPKTLSEDEKEFADLETLIADKDKSTQTKETLSLPAKLNDKRVSYYPRMNNRGGVLLLMAVLTGILSVALERQNREQERSKRRAQMERDYPEIISKLTLFIGAGMTIKRAWRRVVNDYEAQKAEWGVRYAYEEMRQTCNEMDSGITEAESYERFGQRCKASEYVKLGALLSQNLRKGTKGLNEILQTEAKQSFEERKARAKRMGEEAGTKMLAPMFFMLAEVLVIVVVPAFMSVQM